MKVRVFSDYICPFCYIGKERVERLKEEFGVEVEWKGIELHPEIPEGGATPEELGFDQGYIEVAWSSMGELAREDRLDIEPPEKIPSSRLALEISEFAREKGKLEVFKDKVFNAYWKEGRDIGDKEILFSLAREAELEVEELQSYLDSGRGKEKLKENLEEAEREGVVGVPTFVIGEERIVGVQPYPVLKKAIQKNPGKKKRD